jgi:hypothetical protein
MVFVQAANEAVAKKTQATPVATRFNRPRSLTANDPMTEEPFPAYKPLRTKRFIPHSTKVVVLDAMFDSVIL